VAENAVPHKLEHNDGFQLLAFRSCLAASADRLQQP
jgi:hypothetical protein